MRFSGWGSNIIITNMVHVWAYLLGRVWMLKGYFAVIFLGDFELDVSSIICIGLVTCIIKIIHSNSRNSWYKLDLHMKLVLIKNVCMSVLERRIQCRMVDDDTVLHYPYGGDESVCLQYMHAWWCCRKHETTISI